MLKTCELSPRKGLVGYDASCERLEGRGTQKDAIAGIKLESMDIEHGATLTDLIMWYGAGDQKTEGSDILKKSSSAEMNGERRTCSFLCPAESLGKGSNSTVGDGDDMDNEINTEVSAGTFRT